jgi:hypothetical protein
MSAREQTRWKEWADRLRQAMMTARTLHVTKTVDSIIEETGTEKSHKTLRSRRFWNECRLAMPPNGTLVKAGFNLAFEPAEGAEIDMVTFHLNGTWQAIMQRAALPLGKG